jgi:protein LTV1
MQHMREIGQGSGEATWIDAPQKQGDKKRKDKQVSLEDALRLSSLEDTDDLASDAGMSFTSRTTGKSIARPKYEDQQDIPDAIAGFQPGMDPRLREVLEALEDEAYVEEEEDFFASLAQEGGEEIDIDEFENQFYEDDHDFGDDDGWESDATEKPTKEYNIPVPDMTGAEMPESNSQSTPTSLPLPTEQEAIPDSTTDGDWLANFAKAKATSSAPTAFARPSPSIAPSAAYTNTTNGGRRRRRKGALTSAGETSMTASSIARTEALSTLDARFEKLEAIYMNDDILEEDEEDDAMSQMTGMTGMSQMSKASAASNATWKSALTNKSRRPQRSKWSGSQAGGSQYGGSRFGGSQFGGSQAPSDYSEAPTLSETGFSGMLDEFLGGVGGHGRGKRMKKGSGKEGFWGQQGGMEQLDEVRKGLGEARISDRVKAREGLKI